ncbi:MAG: hypothetical protein II592_02345 [Muribaculaceae bacterium]|nr:hypothetical protein [Muribaculaceae bacterium]
MKKIITVVLLAIACAGFMQAKDKEVIVTKQITPYQRNLIPAKTDELKLKTLTFKPGGIHAEFVHELQALMQRVATEDLDHITFTLNVEPMPDGNNVNNLMVHITGFDLMSEPVASRDDIMGVMPVGYKYFIVKPSAANKALLQDIFKIEKIKIKFVREFELVANPIDVLGTQVNAVWQEGSLQLKQCVISDENKLNENGKL